PPCPTGSAAEAFSWSPGWSVDRDVHVVVVVRGGRTTARHAPPAFTGAVGRPDLLGVDQVVDPELAGVGAQEVRDLPAQVTTDHDVDGAALAVLTVVAPRAVGADAREGCTHRTV